MSWFETSGFASIAKNALKEAQKTIDKALDIREETGAAEGNTLSSKCEVEGNRKKQNSAWDSLSETYFKNVSSKDIPCSKSMSAPTTPGQIVNTQPPRSKSPVTDPSSSSSIMSLVKTSSMTDDSITAISDEPTSSDKSHTVQDVEFSDWAWDNSKRNEMGRKGFRKLERQSNSEEFLYCNLEVPSPVKTEGLVEDEREISSDSAINYAGTPGKHSQHVSLSRNSSTDPVEEKLCEFHDESICDKETSDSFSLASPICETSSPSIEVLSPISTDDSFSIQRSNSSEDFLQETHASAITKSPDLISVSAITKQPTSVVQEPKSIPTNVQEDESICGSVHSTSTSSTLTVLDAFVNNEAEQRKHNEMVEEIDNSMPKSLESKGVSVESTMMMSPGIEEASGSGAENLGIAGMSNPTDDATTSEETFSERFDHKTLDSRDNILDDHSAHSSADETTASSDIEIISSPSLDGNNGSSGASLPHHVSLTQRSCPTSPKSSHGSRSSPSCNLKNENEKETLPSSVTESFTSITESDTDFSYLGSTELVHLDVNRFNHNLCDFHSRKGHFRSKSSVSETSESSSDPPTSELDKLLRKMSQLTEILEVREAKVLELSHTNLSLQDANQSLRRRLKEFEGSRDDANETESVREEYIQRLATMEKKFQQALREKEQNQKLIDELKVEAASRKSNIQIDKEMTEKDSLIEELRTEGEKLSKQQLNYSNIIKKLRAKEKENDSTIKNQTKQIEEQSNELDRLQRQLSAKEELERKQIEAIRQFTLTNQKQETELKDLQADKEESDGKARALKDALDTAYREMAELQKSVASEKLESQQLALNAEIEVKERIEKSLEEEKRSHHQEKKVLIAQIHELQDSISTLEAQYNSELEKQKESLENELENLSSKISKSEENKCKENVQIVALKQTYADEITELKKERDILKHQLEFTKVAYNDEKKKTSHLSDQIKEKDRKIAYLESTRADRSTPSPTPSRLSVSGDSVFSTNWTDDVFDSSSHKGSLYDSLRGNSAVTVDIMTSNLRQKEGELHQLQVELTRNEHQKDVLAKELVSLSRNIEELNQRINHYETLEVNYKDMSKKYDALLQMYGEKVEQLEELQMDLSDVKEMYKAQIDQLLQK